MLRRKTINSYDIDGVIFLGDYDGVYPGHDDIIITGRSFEEERETIAMLESKGIHNRVYFNPLPFDKKSRVSSGRHKGHTIAMLKILLAPQFDLGVHFEDDPLQIEEIQRMVPGHKIVYLSHSLTEKENVRHPWPTEL